MRFFCIIKGSWFDFKQKLGGYEIVDSKGDVLSSSSAPKASSSSMYNQSSHSQYKGQNLNYQSNINTYNNGNPSSSRNTDSTTTTMTMNNSSSCLPMPSPKLQATYITNLLDDTNDSSKQALKYLTETRGLTKQTLRKFGVGLGSYKFPSVEPGQQNRFMKADCVTFPWIMRASDIHEQESLRGGSFHYDGSSSDVDGTESSDINANGKEKKNPFVTRRIKARALNNKANQRLDPPG